MARPKPRVYLALRIADEPIARIEAECEVSRFRAAGAPTRGELREALGGMEGLLGSAMLALDRDILESASKLKVVSNYGVGFDNVDVAAATERGIAVCNTPGVLSEAVADLTMALVLSLARRLPEAERFVREGQWQPGSSLGLGMDVGGRTLGIIGMGRIGRTVTVRARAFGMRVRYHDVVRPADEFDGEYATLDELLQTSDFVTLHVNFTEETRGLIGTRELGLMKESAYLINTSRGQVIDQAALVEALRTDRIAGAALDVFEREPVPQSDPILSLPNAIVLPHIGSATRETRAAMLNLAIDNMLAVLRGETPECIVNPEVLEAGGAAQ